MRILGAIVEPTTGLLAIGVADLFHRRGIRAKPVGDDAQRSAIFLHDALEKLQRRGLVPLRRDDCSKTSPSWSTARQRQQSLPLTFSNASSKCLRQ
jgi:hypothetical protein